MNYFHQRNLTKSSYLERKKLLVASSSRAAPVGTTELQVKQKYNDKQGRNKELNLKNARTQRRGEEGEREVEPG